MLIYDKQNHQVHLINMTLKLKTFQVKELIRDIEDNDNNENNHIEFSNRVKNDDCA